MSIDREPRPLGSDWAEALGFAGLDASELTRQGIEIEYDHLMDKALDELDRVTKFFIEGFAAFTVPTESHVERTAVVKDLELAGPRTITVLHNKPQPSATDTPTTGTYMWIFNANTETVEYHFGAARATETGWERSSEAPILVPHGDKLAILVKDPSLTAPHESMPMDDLEAPVPKTQGQVDALHGLVRALRVCTPVSHDETVTDYQYL